MLTPGRMTAGAGGFTFSRQVAQLESELGARLFHGNNREVRLTTAGSVFVPAARRVLAGDLAASS